MPLKSKICTGVSFFKILGFYYKRKRFLLLWRNFVIDLENSWSCKLGCFSEFLCFVAYESIPGDKENIFIQKSTKKEWLGWRTFLKMLPEKISQYSRKTLVLESLFNKVAGIQGSTLLKRDSNTGVFLSILRTF